MKDKRQRMALIWPPYPMYADPALAGALLAAASQGYHTAPSPYSFYAARFSPYGHPSPLHRPQPQTYAPAPPPPHMIAYPGLSSSPPSAVPTGYTSIPSYPRPTPIPSMPQLSPAQSDTSSSDCDSYNNNNNKLQTPAPIKLAPHYTESKLQVKSAPKLFQPYKNDVSEKV